MVLIVLDYNPLMSVNTCQLLYPRHSSKLINLFTTKSVSNLVIYCGVYNVLFIFIIVTQILCHSYNVFDASIALHRTIHILLENFSQESAIGFQIKLVTNYSYYLMHKAISIKAIKNFY